jgi:hypothetical protein
LTEKEIEGGKACDDSHEFVRHREYLGRPLIEPRHVNSQHSVDTEKSIYADRRSPDSRRFSVAQTTWSSIPVFSKS